MLLKSKEKAYFAIDTRAITTLRWACFDKFRFAHEGLYQPRARFQPRCQRYRPLAAWHGRLAACGCGSSRFRPRACSLPVPINSAYAQAVRPVRWLARETSGLRLWKISVRAPKTTLHQSLFLKKYDILSSNFSANSPEYDFEKLKAFPDHSERSSNEGFISTSATVIREIMWNLWRVGRTARFF